MTTHTDDRFEERLLTELRAHVARPGATATAAGPPRRARGRSRGRRVGLLARGPRLAFVGGVAAVAAGIAIVATAGGGAQPAYAVENHGDGSVTVTIRSLTDASGLQRQLRAAGVDADVVKLDPGYVCGFGPGGGAVRVERAAPSGPNRTTKSGATPQPGGASIAVQRHADGTATFTIRQGQVSDDEHLLVSTTTPTGQSDGALVAVTVARGDGAGCTPMRAPAPPTAP